MNEPKSPIQPLFTMVDRLSILQELSTAIPFLSDTEQVLVRYILHHPLDVTTMSAAELATAAGVSEATIFRLCRQLNLGGFTPLKEKIRDAVSRFGEEFSAPIDAQYSGAPDLGAVQSGAYVGIRTLLDACSIDEALMHEAAAAIARSKRILICGMGAITARIAELATFGFQHLGLTAMLWIDSQVTAVSADKVHSGDVVLGISHSGVNQSIARFLELANEVSATTIALTNYAQSPVAKAGHISLVTAGRESTVQNLSLLPRMSQLLVIQVLLNLVEKSLLGEKEVGTRWSV